MSRYDWLLFLHVLAAFALVSAVVLFTVAIAAGWNRDVPSDVVRIFRISRLGEALIGIGSVGALVFGIWLAIDVDGYELWDGWIIAAIVLWLVGSGSGGRLAAAVREGEPAPAIDGARAMVMVMALSTLLLLLDMIFKPGA